MSEFYTLHLAVTVGKYNDVKIFLKNGANVDKYIEGHTPLTLALQYHRTSIAKLLLLYGANVDYPTLLDQMYPLHLASKSGSILLVKVLMELGARMDRKSVKGYYPIHIAVSEGHINVTKLFMDKGVNFQKTLTNNGCSPLHIAAKYGRLDIVKLLLQYTVNVNQADHHGYTALFYAAKKGHTEIVKILIQNGARTRFIHHPIYASIDKGHIDIVKLFYENGLFNDYQIVHKGDTALSFATIKGKTEIVAYLLEQGVNVNTFTNNGYSLLHRAVQYGHLDVVKLLVKHGANVDIETTYKGYTPLHLAVEYVWPDIINYLIHQGANITTKDHNGCTPLNLIFKTTSRNREDLEKSILCVQIILKHMILRNKDLKIVMFHPSNVSQNSIEDFYANCLKEIELMKLYRIGNTTMSLYRFLRDIFDEHKLAVYLCNTDIKQEMMNNSYNYIKCFSIYSDICPLIENQIKRALDFQLLLNRASLVKNDFFSKLPAESKLKIFSYLSYNDLNNFIKSHE